MSDHELPPEEADVNELNSQLSHGLETCRSVLANYRTLLSELDARTSSNDNDPEESLFGIDER